MSEMLPLEMQLNYRFTKFYNKCKSYESQLMQTIIMVASSTFMPLVGKNINNAHKVDLLYSEWLSHRNMIVDDVNIIRELIDVRENYNL